MARKRSKARNVLEKPQVLGWKTSDGDEIAVRQWRGARRLERLRRSSRSSGRWNVRGPYRPIRAIQFWKWNRDGGGWAAPSRAQRNACGSTQQDLARLANLEYTKLTMLFQRRCEHRPLCAATLAEIAGGKTEDVRPATGAWDCFGRSGRSFQSFWTTFPFGARLWGANAQVLPAMR